MKKQTKEGKELYRKKTLILESILNCGPTIFGVVIWGAVFFFGLSWIKSQFLNQEIYGLVVIVWFITISLPLTRIIPPPSLVYEEVSE